MEIGKITLSGIEIITIESLKLHAAINEHTKLEVEGIVDANRVQEYLTYAQAEGKIVVKTEENTLFCGYITKASCKVRAQYAYLSIVALGGTYQWDQHKKSKTYQETDKTYQDIFNEITPAHFHGKNDTIGEVLIQYQETDWEFMKRLASKCNLGIYMDMRYEKGIVHCGIGDYEARQLEGKNVRMIKNMDEYRYATKNNSRDIIPQDAITYELESNELLQLGEAISYQGKTLYIIGMECHMQQADFQAIYQLKTKKGIWYPTRYLTDTAGLALDAKIIDVIGEKVKVHFQIDEAQEKEKAYCFPFSSMQAASDGSGWYYMPEIGDLVKVCLPDWEEKGAFAVSAVSTYTSENNTTDRMADTSVKYMRSPAGQELQLTPSQMSMDGGAGASLFVMKADGSMEWSSNQEINISASETIEILAGQNIEIQANEMIDIVADTSGELLFDESGELKQLGGQVVINSEE